MTLAETNSSGQKVYSFEIPSNATYVIFTNGSSQTVDISYSGSTVKNYPLTTNSQGNYNVNTI